jgi:hypothetical protein
VHCGLSILNAESTARSQRDVTMTSLTVFMEVLSSVFIPSRGRFENLAKLVTLRESGIDCATNLSK